MAVAPRQVIGPEEEGPSDRSGPTLLHLYEAIHRSLLAGTNQEMCSSLEWLWQDSLNACSECGSEVHRKLWCYRHTQNCRQNVTIKGKHYPNGMGQSSMFTIPSGNVTFSWSSKSWPLRRPPIPPRSQKLCRFSFKTFSIIALGLRPVHKNYHIMVASAIVSRRPAARNPPTRAPAEEPLI